MRFVGASASRLTLATGDVLVEQGSDADAVYVVVDGRLEALHTSTSGELLVGVVGPGQIVGEVTVIAGGRRTATLRAVEPGEVLVVQRADFERWLSDNPAAADAMSAEARLRIDRTQVATMLSKLVGDAEPEVLQEMLRRIEWRHLEAGELLFDEGDPSDAAYFVVAGRLLVTKRDERDQPVAIAEVGRGEVVGEMGLLDRVPRSAAVRAVRDSTLAAYRAEVFDELVIRSPALMLHVTRALLSRLPHASRRTFRRAATMTVVVTAPVESEPIVAGMVSAIGRFGTVRRLSSSSIDALLNRPGISQVPIDNVGVPRLVEFLHEADVANDHVVLEADREMSAWTRRALRHADRVVLVVSARPDYRERELIKTVVAEARQLEHVTLMLAIAHSPSTEHPEQTAAMLDEFEPDESVHFRVGSSVDTARLGRLASGRGVGLVFSGGGARGFAHLGAYRALIESGVPVDALGGCSIGATMASAIAIDTPTDSLIEFARRQFHRLLDYTLPVVSLMKGQRISASIEQVFGSRDIEDFWLPYYCVSTNLTQSTLQVHRRGNAARAVRASVAIPGILPPVPYGGDLLVDGGVLNNMPFQVMRDDRRIGTVIAIDVAPARGPRAQFDYGTSVSGMRALASTVRRSTAGYPSVAAVLLRSMLVGAVNNQRLATADGAVDLLVTLDLPGIGLLDFGRVPEVAELGYLASAPTIKEWALGNGWSAS